LYKSSLYVTADSFQMKWTLKDLNMWPALVFTESYSSKITAPNIQVHCKGLILVQRKLANQNDLGD